MKENQWKFSLPIFTATKWSTIESFSSTLKLSKYDCKVALMNLHPPHKKKERPIVWKVVYFPCGVWSVCTTCLQATKIELMARLFISKHPCKDVWVAFILLIKPIEMSLVTLSHFSSLILSSFMHKVLECNLITLLIFDFGRLLMSGQFKSDQEQVRLYNCT